MSSQKEKEVIQRFKIDVKKLKKEQLKISKKISLKDEKDFKEIEFIGAFSNIIIQGKILSAIIVLDRNSEIVEQKYFIDKIKFPYLPEFRAYRELSTMLSCLAQIEQKPELVFIEGLGINHIRLGIASHFSINSGIPSIAITDKIINFKVKGNNVTMNNKEVGKVIQTKIGSKPLYVSPGSGISVSSAVEITKNLTKKPHKMPQPLRMARKYAKKIQREIFS